MKILEINFYFMGLNSLVLELFVDLKDFEIFQFKLIISKNNLLT